MTDSKPLTDNQADDRLKAALAILGQAPGVTVAADTALNAARRALALLSLGLISAGVSREAADDPPPYSARNSGPSSHAGPRSRIRRRKFKQLAYPKRPRG